MPDRSVICSSPNRFLLSGDREGGKLSIQTTPASHAKAEI